MHGGLVATVLDEAMAWVIGVHARRFSYCAELNTRYLAPVSPGVDLMAFAEVVACKRGRLFMTRAELRNAAGEVLVSATGKYLPIPAALHAEMLGDFAENPGNWLDLGDATAAGNQTDP